MKSRRKFIKSLALVALIPTFAIAIAAVEDGYYTGYASASSSSATTSITYHSTVSESSATATGCESYATIGNSLDWVRDENSGTSSSSAYVSSSKLDSAGGSAQSSRAVSSHKGETIYSDYWSRN